MAEARPYKDATNQFAALGPTSLLSQYMSCGTRACVTTSYWQYTLNYIYWPSHTKNAIMKILCTVYASHVHVPVCIIEHTQHVWGDCARIVYLRLYDFNASQFNYSICQKIWVHSLTGRARLSQELSLELFKNIKLLMKKQSCSKSAQCDLMSPHLSCPGLLQACLASKVSVYRLS